MSKQPNRAKLWFLVHSYLALPIWFFMLIICLTGTLATISQEIVWLADPAVRASAPSDDSQRLSYDALMAQVKKQQPEFVVSYLDQPSEDHFALIVEGNLPDGKSLSYYVNPYTGNIQGQSADFNFKQFTRALHGWWLVPFSNGYSWGWYLVCLMALPMLASLITGLVVYKKFWKGFFKPRLRFSKGARIFWGDFHRLAGLWSLLFIFIIAITGIWFLVQAILFDNQINYRSNSEIVLVARQDVPTTHGLAPVPVSLEQILDNVELVIPSLTPIYIGLPNDAYSPITVWGRGAYPLMGQSAEVNPYTGKIMKTHLLSDRSAFEFFAESMRPLHTGDFGGLWIKLIWFFFGLLLSFMVLSGLFIWTKRTWQATQALLKKSPTHKSSWWQRWRFHLNVLLICVPVYFTSQYFHDQAFFRGELGLGEHIIGDITVGPWTVTLAEMHDEAPEAEAFIGYEKEFTAAISLEHNQQIKAMYLNIGKPRSLRTAGGLFVGSPYRLFTEVAVSPNTSPDALLFLTVEGWDGTVHQATFPLAKASPATLNWLKQQQGKP